MGFWISICTAGESGGKLKIRKIVHHAYLSYNFADLAGICKDHCCSEKCPSGFKCETSHIWYYRHDCDGKKGKDIIEPTKNALSILASIGINPGVPDKTNPNWGFGVTSNGVSKLDNKERLEIFAFHLSIFLELAQKYSKYYFLGDDYDRDDNYTDKSSDESSDESSNEII